MAGAVLEASLGRHRKLCEKIAGFSSEFGETLADTGVVVANTVSRTGVGTISQLNLAVLSRETWPAVTSPRNEAASLT